VSSAGVRPGLRKLTVRVAERADEPALAALEQASPDGSPVSVRLQPRLGYLDVADRYPGTTGFVALAPGRLGIVGMLFSSVAPTQFNGSVVPGAYLFSLRVHPAVRRRGVAASLIRHALDQARREAGIEVAWAAVMSGNEPSLRTFSRAGFAPTRGLMLRIRFPGRPRPRTDPAHTLRRAIDPDLSAMADVLNHANARHNLWRPATPSNLAAQFGAAGHGLADVPLVVDRDGRIIAVGAVFDVRRAFSPQAVELRGVPALLSRAVSSMVTRVALRPLVLRDRALLDSEPAAASRLLRSIQGLQTARLSTLIVPVDICDPAWPTVVRATQLTRRLHVMLWSTMRSDENRPLALT
jgi:ribosomal protein S18 acetylase RimI-like enzyme